MIVVEVLMSELFTRVSRRSGYKVAYFSRSPLRGIVRKVYFCFSFGFLLARTTAVSLYAASVHDESRLPAPILYSVSGSSYGNEVRLREILLYSLDRLIFITDA